MHVHAVSHHKIKKNMRVIVLFVHFSEVIVTDSLSSSLHLHFKCDSFAERQRKHRINKVHDKLE